MRKLYIIPIALVLFSLFSASAFAFSTDNNWKMFVSHYSCDYKSPGADWYKLNYDEAYSAGDCPGDPYTKWVTATGDGTIPIRSTGSDPVYFRKWVSVSELTDLWLRAWEGNAGECYVNEQKATDNKIQLMNYLKPGNNLIACKIQGTGKAKDNVFAYFYGQFIPVSDSQLAWSHDWKDWFVSERPTTSKTKVEYYYCYSSSSENYACFTNKVWPWPPDWNGEGVVFTKSFYLDSTENSYLLIGTDNIVAEQYCWSNGQCFNTIKCTLNGSPIGFSENTHQTYNYIADISGKAKPGPNTVQCYYPNKNLPPEVKDSKHFNLAFVQRHLDILGLSSYSVSIEYPTISILVNGNGEATVYAELLENGKSIIEPVEDTVTLNGQVEVLLTLEPPKTGKYSVKVTAVYNEYGISRSQTYELEFTEPAPVIISNPFVQSSGGGSGNSDTSSSGSIPIVPLTAGLAGAAAVGAGYAAVRRYGKPSVGPQARLKEFQKTLEKEEEEYKRLLPSIRAEVEELEKLKESFREQARKKKEAEELENIAEKVAWLNKLAGAGKLSTIEVSKELRVLAGTKGIGYENYVALNNASKELETTLTVDTNKKDSPLDSAYKALTSFTDWAGSGINWGLDQIRDFVGWLFYSGKDFGNFGLDALSGIPFVGGYLEGGIRVPWNLLEDNTRNLRNYIVGDTERLNSIADKLSIGGLGLVGAGTVSMMTGIGAPFAVPAMVAGAGMLVAGSVIDVSTWLSNESIRKANGWHRLRGVLGALTLLPELGAAGKVSKVSKLTKLQGKELHTMVVAAEKLFRLPRGTPIWDIITPFGKPLKLAKYRKYLENASAITQLKTGVITLGKYVRDIYETLLHEVSHTQTRSIIDSLVSVGGKDKFERIYNYLVENLLITRGDRNLVEDILADKLSLKADYIKYSANIRNMIIERLSDWESLGKLSPKDEIVIAQIYVYAKSFLRDTTLTQKIETLLKFENKFIRKDIFSIYKKFKEIGDLADIAELSKKDITTIISGIFGSYIHKIRNLITKGRRDIEVEGDI